MTDTRCPHCDHVFGAEEITDGWCAACGKKIPETILKDVRPRPAPVPHPLPGPTKEERAEERRDSKVRGIGLLIVLISLAVGVGAIAWIAYCKQNRADPGPAPGWTASIAFALFLFGLTMLTTGRTDG